MYADETPRSVIDRRGQAENLDTTLNSSTVWVYSVSLTELELDPWLGEGSGAGFEFPLINSMSFALPTSRLIGFGSDCLIKCSHDGVAADQF